MARYDPVGNGHVHEPVISALASSGTHRGDLLDKLERRVSLNGPTYDGADFSRHSRYSFDVVDGAGSSSVDHVDIGGAAKMARMDGQPTPHAATPHKQWLVRVLKTKSEQPPARFFEVAVRHPEIWGRYYDSFVVELGPGDAM